MGKTSPGQSHGSDMYGSCENVAQGLSYEVPSCWSFCAGHSSYPVKVLPEAGTLVIFRADTMLHKVVPARTKRCPM